MSQWNMRANLHIYVGYCLLSTITACHSASGAGASSATSSGAQVRSFIATTMAEADAGVAAVSADAAPLAQGLPASPPAADTAPSVRLPTIQRSRLPNGIELNVVEHRALPVVHVQILLRGAGAIFDPANKMGLASFTAELLREGAGALGSAEIAARIDASGARISTDTGDDALKITLDVLPERLTDMLTLVGSLIAHPRFDQPELERLRRRELDRLQQEQTEPSWLSQRPFYRALYPAGHPYSRFDTTPAVLRSLTRDDVVRFHHAQYVAGSMVVVAVGAVSAEEFTLTASRAFAEISQGNVTEPAFAPVAAPVASAARTILLVNRPNSQQSYVRVGRVGPRRSDPVWPSLAVSNQVLGAAPSSRLFVDLRERRSLTYGVYSRVSSAVHEGVVSASGSTRTPTTGEFVGALLAHLDGMSSVDVPDEELSGARRVLQNRFTTSIATAADLTGKITDLRQYGLPDDWFDSYRTALSTVSAQDVRASSNTYWSTTHSVIVVVGDVRRVLPQLRPFGTVRVLRLGE